MKLKKRTIFLAFLDLCAISFILVVYVVPNFKNWWITTSVSTGKHKWFANIFYTDEDIKEVLTNNQVIEIDEEVNLDDITFENEKKDSYDSVYDEQILDREDGALYKLINIKEKNYSGYLVAIYDPSRIHLITSDYYGQSLKMLAEKNNAVVAINASGFNISQGYANGMVIKDSKLVSNYGYNRHGGGLVGFTKKNVLMLTTSNSSDAIAKGMRDAVEFGPFLIINGKPATIVGNGGMGTANRTVIAQRKDGIVLFLVIDGRGANGSKGIDMNGLIKILTRYKAYNAANLDGGGSSTLVINNELINNPRGYYGDDWERPLPNAWIVK
jgi:exopolysaccharide biosynthesis protein